MNRLYERTTKRRTASQLDATLRTEVTAHAEAHQLGDVLGAAVNLHETWSVRLRKPGLLSRLTGPADPDTEHRTVGEGKKRGVHVHSARLDGISLSESSELQRLARGNSTSAGRLSRLLPDDFGMSVTALWSGAPEAASFYIGVSDDSAGHALLDELHAAVTRAKSS
ncbi:hypothetical protein [Streptomyces sp. NBC_00268]|uniref:hypothetical protein n=1 Tax=Streptomyces sp. NBC_00268 TaxID=2975695 RepID=UPI002254F1A2|nr:hypothetical protein [Streptomyces sp. NBC_00268]MCX5183000.1 hypothetical protein [Streptomyces sp. NBC_00268]